MSSTPTTSASVPGAEPPHPPAVIEVTIPAAAAHVSAARAVAADIAARSEFNVEHISDLRMAVDEACGSLIPLAEPGSAIACRFEVRPGVVSVVVSAQTVDGAEPATDGFGWYVLQALTDEASITTEPEPGGTCLVRIEFLKRQ